MHEQVAVAAVPGEVSIGDLVDSVTRRWKLVAAITVAGSIAGYIFGLVQTPIYRAEVLVTPMREQASTGTLGSIAAQLGGLGQIAGIPGLGVQDTPESIALLKSRRLAQEFIEEQGLKPALFPERWDAATGRWRADAGNGEPTPYEVVTRFNNSVKQVNENKLTGLVTLAMEGPDRTRVAEWANGFVAHVNSSARQQAIKEASDSITYLNAELGRTQYVEVRQAIYRLIEAQIGRRMMASTRKDYAFRIVDPAMPADAGRTVRPRKLLLAAIGGAMGLGLALVIVLVLGAFTQRKS